VQSEDLREEEGLQEYHMELTLTFVIISMIF